MESEEVGIITSKDEVNGKVYIWAMESKMDFEWPMHDLKTSDWVSVSIKQGQVLNCNKVLDYLPTKRNHQRFKIHTTVLRPPEDWSQRNSYVKYVLSPDFGKVVNSYAIHLSPDVAYEAYVQFDYRLRSQYGTCWFLSKQEAFQSDDQSLRDMMPWSIEVTQEEQGNRSRKPIPDGQMDHLKNHEKIKKVQAQNSNNLDDLWELFGVITTSEISAQECLQPIHASTPAPETTYNLLENGRSTSDYRVDSINYQSENLNQHHHQVPSTSFSTLDRNYAHSMNTTEVLDSDLENDLMNFTIQSGSSASANFTNGPRYGVIVQKIGREKISCYIWTPSDPQLFYHVERPNDRIVIGTWISYEKTRPLCKKNQAAVEWNSQNEACGVQLLNGSLVPTRQAKFGIECMVDIVVQNPDLSPKYVYASNDFFGNQSIIIRRDDYTPRDFSPNKIRRVWIAYARLTNEDDSKWVWQFSEFAENRPRMALPKTLKCDFDSVDAHWQGNNLFVLEPNSNTNIAVFNEFAYGFGASYKQYLRLVKAQAQLEYFGVDEDLSDLNYGVIVRSENRYAIIWSFRENGYVLVPENNQDPRNPEKMIYEIGDWVTYQAYDSSGNDYVECIYREVFVLPELLTQPKIPTIILSFTFMCEVDQLNVVKNKEVVLGSKKFCVAYNDLLGLVLVPHTSTSEEILRRDIAPQAWVLFTNQAYRDYNWYTIYLWNGQRHHYVKLAPAYDLIFDETLKSALKAHLLSERFFGTEEDYYRRYNIKPRFTHLYVSDLLGLVVPNFNENSSKIRRSTAVSNACALQLATFFPVGTWLTITGNITSGMRGETITVNGHRIVPPPMPTRVVNVQGRDELILSCVVEITDEGVKNSYLNVVDDLSGLIASFDHLNMIGDRYVVELILTDQARQNGIQIGQIRHPCFRICKVHDKWREGQPISVPLKNSYYSNASGQVFNMLPDDLQNDNMTIYSEIEERDDLDSDVETLVGVKELENCPKPVGEYALASEMENCSENGSSAATDITRLTSAASEAAEEIPFYQADWDDD